MSQEFIAEWVPYENEMELEEAYTYLGLWLRFFLKKHPHLEKVDAQLHIQPITCHFSQGRIGAKVLVKKVSDPQ